MSLSLLLMSLSKKRYGTGHGALKNVDYSKGRVVYRIDPRGIERKWLQAYLNDLIDSMEGPERYDMFDALGTELIDQTRERIETEKTSPAGKPWKPWSEGYKRQLQKKVGQRTRKADRRNMSTSALLRLAEQTRLGFTSTGNYSLLQHDGHLFESIAAEPSETNVRWGTTRIYGRRHQRGGGGIPRRPFLGLSHGNIKDLQQVIIDFFERQASKASLDADLIMGDDPSWMDR